MSTSLKARNRPRAGGVPPTNTTTAPSTVESNTLLQQAQAYRYNDAPPQQNFQSHAPVVNQSDMPPKNMPAYLNPYGERPSRDPSPVGKRFADREFTHARSRSDPLFVKYNSNMMTSQHGGPQNIAQHPSQQQQSAMRITQQQQQQQQQQQMNAPQITYAPDNEPTPNFPKWNPFSSDFVVNTTTTDDDFASLREPMVQHGQQSSARVVEPAVQHGQRNTGQAYAPQFVGGNTQMQFEHQRSSSNSNISPYASDSSRRSSDCEDDAILARPIVRPNADDYFGGSRKNDAFLDSSVNAGCDVDEMTTSFNRNTTLHEPARAQSGHTNNISGVFDSAPFRKPVQASPVVKTTPAPPVSLGRDPFGAVPFKQKEAARLARRQAKRNKEQSSIEARRVLPTIPTQARR